MSGAVPDGAVTGGVQRLLRLEGACILVAALCAYSRYGQGWGHFALWFLVPDLSFLGYLQGPRLGALCYNAAHSLLGAVTCLLAGVWLAQPVVTGAGLIWCAHIGFDRMLGYGLKYAAGFRFTHLGRIGHSA